MSEVILPFRTSTTSTQQPRRATSRAENSSDRTRSVSPRRAAARRHRPSGGVIGSILLAGADGPHPLVGPNGHLVWAGAC